MAIVKVPTAVKMRLDDRVKYAKNEKKTRLNERAEYAVNPDKTDDFQFAACINCTGLDTAYEEMQAVQRTYGKESRVLGYSFIQSFKPGETMPEVAHAIGMRLAGEYFGDKYQIVVGTHLDKEHLHNHIIINSVSFVDGRKYLNKLHYLTEIRGLSDRLCEEYGLSVIREKSGERTTTHTEWKEQQEGIPSRDDLLRADIDAAIEASVSFVQFANRMRDQGYSVKFGPNVKYMTIAPPGGNGRRIYRLGEQYTEQAIRERIMQRLENLWQGEVPEAKKRTPVKRRRAIGNPRKAKTKLAGWRALYFHYLYRLGAIRKHPQSCSRRTAYLLRDDLRKFEQYKAQYQFLIKHDIQTGIQLKEYAESVQTRMKPLYDRRKTLYNEKRAQGNENRQQEIRNECAAIADELKPLRAELKMCKSIEERSEKVREAARQPLYTTRERSHGADGRHEERNR